MKEHNYGARDLALWFTAGLAMGAGVAVVSYVAGSLGKELVGIVLDDDLLFEFGSNTDLTIPGVRETVDYKDLDSRGIVHD
jgi:hypothetical protein